MRRFVVWGDNALARRLVGELINSYGAQVTAVVPSLSAHQAPQIAELCALDPWSAVVREPRLTAATFSRPELAEAEAVAFVDADDVANVDAALIAREALPDVRVVLRMFNTVLGEGVASRLRNCAVLSASEIAAPAFVAAARGDHTPTAIRLSDGQRLAAVERATADPAHIRCGLAVTGAPAGGPDRDPVSLPADDGAADLVLVSTYDRPRPAPRRVRRHPLRMTRLVLQGGLRRVLAGVAALIATGTVVVATVKDLSPWRALYVTVLTTLGGANADLEASRTRQAVDLALVVAGVAVIPAVTAAVVNTLVKARLKAAAGGLAVPVGDHVIVVGLGNVGARVVQGLHDQGIDVVAVDRSGAARGVAVARGLGIPVILGDARDPETLQAASVATARCLVMVTTDDVTNLEAALLARASRPDLRVVLRLFDEDFARRIKTAFGLNHSRSVSYLAAPAFAASMVGSEVVDTIPVGRRVLLVAEVRVGARSRLEDRHFHEVSVPGELRLVAVRTGRRSALGEGVQTFWYPERSRGRTLDRAHTMVVVATRAGLVSLLERAAERPG
ncbi:NAD-binding protein [Dactylosporangium aurantiacum]|uniref:NAD-binding protein n=1 Tax=Dactylosporangium aurantiacum TaxID=35754 RepID=A0A9Q9MI24_9ACTN|nr:NAD(P)-binding protein [Dactylosporangium aurantiacum]MDG6109439.1 NAD-binding protein [Dactylosporangium aurantiacum]UWZ55435.1 NAD-binding protein [Dactylosporangium aurantiacum]